MPPNDPLQPQREIYSVTRLNHEVRVLLESGFPVLWLEAELSNLSRPASGHWYFSLKDKQAQVRCAMFRNRNQQMRLAIKDGLQVLVRAKLGLYEARGDYQLIVEHMELAGHGALQREFEALKQRLSAQGLFDPAGKQALPRFVKRLGVITSPTGAALRDILSVLRRRFPALPVLIYPVPVQGEGAGAKIAAAIQRADQDQHCDALILARGGGSLEDLWAFNDEAVARAIHACRIPLVCGVGHEVDFSIADFAADVRAATPSAAAELLSPDQVDLFTTVSRAQTALQDIQRRRLTEAFNQVQWLEKRLHQQHPARQLAQQAQRLDELELRLTRAWTRGLRQRSDHLAHQRLHLQRLSPALRVQALSAQEAQLRQRLLASLQRRLEQGQTRLQGLGRALNAVSPLATLGRGYAIVRREPQGDVVRKAQQSAPGERVRAHVAQGSLLCEVIEIARD